MVVAAIVYNGGCGGWSSVGGGGWLVAVVDGKVVGRVLMLGGGTGSWVMVVDGVGGSG